MTEKDNRMAANKAVREWKVGHKREYDDFKQQVASIGKGDLSLMERMIGLLDDCMPQDARNFYGYIYKYIGAGSRVHFQSCAYQHELLHRSDRADQFPKAGLYYY